MAPLGFAVSIFLCTGTTCELIAVRPQRFSGLQQCNEELPAVTARLTAPREPAASYRLRCDNLDALCAPVARLKGGLIRASHPASSHQTVMPARVLKALELLCKTGNPNEACEG